MMMNQRVARSCGLLTSAAALAVLCGWLIRYEPIVRIVPGLSTMKVNTALCLLLVGVGLIIRGLRGDRAAQRLVISLGSIWAVVAGVTLAQYITGGDLGIDTLLLGDAQRSLEPSNPLPGRMAPASAVALVLLGAALAVSYGRPLVSQLLALGPLLIGYLSTLGYF